MERHRERQPCSGLQSNAMDAGNFGMAPEAGAGLGAENNRRSWVSLAMSVSRREPGKKMDFGGAILHDLLS